MITTRERSQTTDEVLLNGTPIGWINMFDGVYEFHCNSDVTLVSLKSKSFSNLIMHIDLVWGEEG